MTGTGRPTSWSKTRLIAAGFVFYVILSVVMKIVFRSLDLPLLTEVLILVAFMLLFFVALRWVLLPRLARKPSPYPRTTRADEWTSSLDTTAALTAIETTLREHDPRARVQREATGDEIRAFFGSDPVFRFRGSGSRKGWAALPVAASFRATPDGEGTRITGEIRDDLAWNVTEPPPFVATEVNHRAAVLLRRAREATTDAQTTTEIPDPPR